MTKFICRYCEKELSNKYNLDMHTKNAKYCLSLRDNCENAEIYGCDYCGLNLSTPQNLKRHLTRCPEKKICDAKSKYSSLLLEKKRENKSLKIKLERSKKTCDEMQETIDELKEQMVSLESQLAEQKGSIDTLKTVPSKTYNAYIHPKLVNLPVNNIPALTQEYMTEQVNNGILTYEKASRGYPGMLEIICEMITHENANGIIERSYVCTDVSRNSFHRLLESKKWKSDKGGRYLNNILDTFRDVIEEYKNKVYDEYSNTPHDSIEWYNVEWARKNISMLYSGIVRSEGTSGRDELVNILRREISKRASV